MTISVTEEDIKNGARAEEELCPVALAIKRALMVNAEVLVGFYNISVGKLNVQQFDYPPGVHDFIDDFDDGEHVHPFTFDLPIDPEKL